MLSYFKDGVVEEVELSSKELVPGDQILLPATGGKYHHHQNQHQLNFDYYTSCTDWKPHSFRMNLDSQISRLLVLGPLVVRSQVI